VFNATTGTLITQVTSPSTYTSENTEFIGYSVAVSGNTVVLGAYLLESWSPESGEAFVYNATTGSLLATFSNHAPANRDYFGSAVAVSGNTIVVGAPYDNTGGLDNGQAYLFNAQTQ
jgi:outer membrane protein assembly factor BamB